MKLQWMQVGVLVALLTVPGWCAAQPHVAVLSDMESLEAWEGPAELTTDRTQGKSAMCIKMGKGGAYTLTHKDFAASGIDLTKYDVLKFDYKITGGRLTLDTNMRQWPFLGGYQGEFYPLKDSFRYPESWQEQVVNLAGVENCRQGYNKDQPQFLLIIHAEADAADVRLYLDNLRFVKRLITVECIDDRFMHFGERHDQAEGSLQYRYDLRVTNRSEVKQKVRMRVSPEQLRHFTAGEPAADAEVQPGETVTMPLVISLSAEARKTLKPFYYETCRVTFDLPGVPDSDFWVELLPAVPYQAPAQHPYLLVTPERVKLMRSWVEKWGWAKSAAQSALARADFAMQFDPNLPSFTPREEQPGDRICPNCGDQTELYVVEDPLSVDRFQCTRCGKMLSPKIDRAYRDTGYWWHPEHPDPRSPEPGHGVVLSRYGNVLDLAVAYQLTGERRYAERVAEVVRAYNRVYPDYPLVRTEAYSTFDSKAGGRIGGFFDDFGWTERMTDTLDLIWDAGVLTAEEKQTFLETVLERCITSRIRLANYMVHRLNQAGGGYAILADSAPLGALVMESPYGLRPHLIETMRTDGLNYMAPQYQSVTMGMILPILRRYDNAGLDYYTEPVRKHFTSWYLWTDPDGNTPDLGDSTWTSYRSHTGLWLFEQGYAKYGDPSMVLPVQEHLYAAWQKSKLKWEDLPRPFNFPRSYDVLLYGVENIPRGKPDASWPSQNFADYGLLVFNQGQGDKRLWMALPYGKPAGHGHNDKLHIEWWALGQKMTKKGGGYATAPSAPWWKHPATHNTLLVDQRDQMNVPGVLETFVGEGPVQGAVITHDDMYPGVRLQRTVMLYDGCIFLFDRAESQQEHIYDFAYRNAGQLTIPPAPREGVESLGQEINNYGQITGYTVFRNIRKGTVSSPLHVTWDSLLNPEARVRLTQWADPQDPAELLLVDAPFDQSWAKFCSDADQIYRQDYPDGPEGKFQYYGRALLVRKSGKTAGYFTALEPYLREPRIAELQRLPLTVDGKPVTSSEGVAFRMQIDGVSHVLMMCPQPGAKRYANRTTRAFFECYSEGEVESF